MYTLWLVNNNKVKNYLTFEYCWPTSLLISYVKTREVGSGGLRPNQKKLSFNVSRTFVK